ncbi:MAG: hypothetical protein E6G29_08335 [Actinobacteria bacterium]|nr:MAG: hypothetical protein E6G29_08335 [Actinomycetota bacterium]
MLAAAVALAGAAAARAGEPVNVNWPSYLPALPGPNRPQPHAVPHCRTATVRCIDVEIQRLRALQRRLGCAHRAVFTTTYLELTRTLRQTLRKQPNFFRYPRYLYIEDALFADVYFNTIRAGERGRPVPPAWQIAFDTARSGQVNAGQDMLLGINAHVQNDMPFVLAALGQRTRSGASRKVDHDRVNEILNRAYEPVVEAVARRYDPLISTTNASWSPVDDIAGMELVKTWREGVWRNAERLLNAKTSAERRQVADQIETNAATWARFMAAPQQPGYRATRDAYCRAKLAHGA